MDILDGDAEPWGDWMSEPDQRDLRMLGAMLMVAKFMAESNARNKERNAKLEALEAEVRELKAAPKLEYKGVWASDLAYDVGAFVTHGGSLWHSNVNQNQARPGEHSHWTLVAKRGRDGRDVR